MTRATWSLPTIPSQQRPQEGASGLGEGAAAPLAAEDESTAGGDGSR